MSKAFTKESDVEVDAEAPLPPRPALPLPITAAGLQALRAEHQALVDSGQGAGRRARTLQQIFATTVVREAALHEGGVGFGCDVDVRDRKGHRHRYRIAGPDESDPARGVLSVNAPLARALWGQRKGDLVGWAKPNGDEEELEILDVLIP